MKASIIYFSDSGNTQKMAGVIAEGMMKVEGVEAKTFSLDELDKEWIAASSCIIVGTPTYMASMSAKLKLWLEGPCMEFGLAGKIGGAFATANYIHGGGDIAVQTILDHLLVGGMLVYSGGAMLGEPVIHMGPVAIGEKLAESEGVFALYGERMAMKAKEIFG